MGHRRDVDTDGVLVTDPAFAGSDTLATARALAAAIRARWPVRPACSSAATPSTPTPARSAPSSRSCSTSPFATGVRHLAVDGDRVDVRCEYDDGWVQAWLSLPAVLSTAERLIEPCKVEPDERAMVDAARIRRLSAAELGPGPWGEDGSPTRVGTVRVHEVAHGRCRLDGPVDAQVRDAVAALIARGALDTTGDDAADDGTVAVAGPDRDRSSQSSSSPTGPSSHASCSGPLASLATQIDGNVVAITVADEEPTVLGSSGADEIAHLTGIEVEEDVARAGRLGRRTRAVGPPRSRAPPADAKSRGPRRRATRCAGSPATPSASK